jgi:hypothetical protein
MPDLAAMTPEEFARVKALVRGSNPIVWRLIHEIDRENAALFRFHDCCLHRDLNAPTRGAVCEHEGCPWVDPGDDDAECPACEAIQNDLQRRLDALDARRKAVLVASIAASHPIPPPGDRT